MSSFSLFSIKLFHIISTYHKLSGYRKLLSSEAECLSGDLKRYTLSFNKDTAWGYRAYESLRITLTFTHSHFGRLLSVRLVREDSDPDLTLTLHVT